MSEEICHFFKVYKQLEGKKTSVTKVLGVKEAKEIIKKAMAHFDQEIANKK